MSNNEFSRFVSIDFAPYGSICEWCGRPAEEQLTAVGEFIATKVAAFVVSVAKNSCVW